MGSAGPNRQPLAGLRFATIKGAPTLIPLGPARLPHSVARGRRKPTPDWAPAGRFVRTGAGSPAQAVRVSTPKTSTTRGLPRSASTLTCMLVPAGAEPYPALFRTERWRKASAAGLSSDTKPNVLSRLNHLTRAVPITAAPSPALRFQSGRLLAQVQVGGIELPGRFEPLPIEHRERARPQGDQPLTPEFLQGPVHMH